MRLFIKKILLFVGLLLLSFCIVILLNYFLFRLDNPLLKKQTSTHILLLGDSNMECAIDDSIFKGSTNLSASSDSYFYCYLKLRYYISKDQNIDTVFLSFSPHNIFDNGWLLDDNHIYSHFRNYYFLMEWTDFKFLYSRNSKAIISSFPAIFNQTVRNIAKISLRKGISSSYGGYLSANRNILEEVKSRLKKGEPLPFFRIPDNFKVSAEEVAYLEKIIELCREYKIKLYLVNLPKRIELLNYNKYGLNEFYEYYDSHFISIDFLDFSRINIPDNYYDDLVHLNRQGSTYFSEYLEKNNIDFLEQSYKRENALTQNIMYE